MGESFSSVFGERNTVGQRYVPAPYQSAPNHTGTIQGVWAYEDEEVQWIWSNGPDGSYVCGYTLIKHPPPEKYGYTQGEDKNDHL